MSAVEAEVFGRSRPRLLGHEKQLPDLFMCCAKESLQGLRTSRIELPHMERPALAGEDPTKMHHPNHVDKIDVSLEEGSDAAL